MKKKMNVVLTGLTLLLLVFSLAACGGSDKKASDEKPVAERPSIETGSAFSNQNNQETATAAEAINQEATWEISDDCTTLIVKGNGAWRPTYEEECTITDFGQTITTLIVEEGITSLSYTPTNIIGASEEGGLYNLTDVSLPSTLEEIDAMFLGAVSLKELEIPDGVTTIGSNAFGLCGFTEVTIPESVNYIGHRAFWHCDNLETVNIMGTVDLDSEAFSFCEKLKNVNAHVIRSIGDEAFWCCPLETIVLNEGLEEVGAAVFDSAGIKTITFPNTLKKMSKNWLGNGYYLEEVRFDGTKKEWISMGLDLEYEAGLLGERTVTVEFLR